MTLREHFILWLGGSVTAPDPIKTVEYKIVEMPSRPLSIQSDKEMREVVQTLSAHPGWTWLMNKLSYQMALLKQKLDYEKHADLREVDFLQAGIYWAGWLHNEAIRATTKMPERHMDAMQEELEAFNEINKQIERIG